MIVAALLAVWVLASWLPVRGVSEPLYRVVGAGDGYEIREYAPFVIAATFVPGETRQARNKGFRRVAGYIFGANVQGKKVPMTAPVLSGDTAGRALPMTAPVLEAGKGEGTTLAFVMPAGETLESLPEPDDPAIQLRKVRERLAAVAPVPLHPSERKVGRVRDALLKALARDGREEPTAVATAYYNPPWTIPFLRRTEVIAFLAGEGFPKAQHDKGEER